MPKVEGNLSGASCAKSSAGAKRALDFGLEAASSIIGPTGMTCARRLAGVSGPVSSSPSPAESVPGLSRGCPLRPDPRIGRSRARSLLFLPVVALLFAAAGLLPAVPAQADHLVKPTGLEALPSPSFVSLYWTQTDPTAASQITPSEIQYGKHPDGALRSTTLQFRGQTRAHAIIGLDSSTTYRFRIRAGSYGAHVAGPWSDWVTATTLPRPIPNLRVPRLSVTPVVYKAVYGKNIVDLELHPGFCERFIRTPSGHTARGAVRVDRSYIEGGGSVDDLIPVRNAPAPVMDSGRPHFFPGDNVCTLIPEGVPATAPGNGPALTAAFERVPAEHDGRESFWFNVRFSEALGDDGAAPVAASFAVGGGKVKGVRRLRAGLWRVRVQPDSWRDVTMTLAGGRDCDAAGGVCAPDGRALSNTSRATVGGPVRIRVQDAKGREGRNATLGFAVTLNRAAAHEVSVDYATADGSAKAGADYTAASGTLVFAPGETAKTVTVAILDDAIDEGKETFLLKLSNPQGAFLRSMHREAKGVIRNDDPLQAMWLARFGRMVAADAVAAVTARFETPRAAGSQLTLRGQRLDLSRAGDARALAEAMTGLARAFGGPAAPAADEDDPFRRHGLSNTWNDPAISVAPAPTGRELLLGSSFRAVLPAGAGTQFTSWGQGASVSRFSAGAGGLGLSGEAATGSMGFDYESGRLLTGFALTHSVGDGAAQDAGWSYRLGSTATTVLPYARYALTDRVSAWAMAGTGTGSLSLDLDGAVPQRYRADLAMTLAAAGVRGDLVQPAEPGGFALALKADAFWVRTESDRVASSEFGSLMGARGEASRVRATLDGSRSFALAGGAALSPSLELGLREDGGDAETGTGLEFGAGLGYADPSRGLDMALKVRGLAVHAADGYEEWGVSGQLRLVPGDAGRGLSASLTPSWGVDPGGSQRLWALPESSGRLAANPGSGSGAGGEAVPSSRLDAEMGYGMALFGDRFTGTPNVGLGLTDTAREMRLGWRLTSAVANDPGLEVSLDATRREAANGNEPPEHAAMLRSTIRW